ncbi:hypothetical protein QFC21_000734 [Naganishia friedmannii]|uniref:Uncharacterized protein n=1 Tax=Naganishia friedmannii TaxID=89922 RepID=A0ACC2W6L3_9TREE|nr:hypothetical protein QFC21_000734 [Naganishia friedmannii]
MNLSATPRLPPDLIEECLGYLPARDLLRCQLVTKSFQDQIKQNKRTRYKARDELQRLSGIEERMAKLLYGKEHPLTTMCQLGVPGAVVTDMHLVSTASGFLFFPLSAPGSFGMASIARYRLGAFSEGSDIIHLGRAASHLQLDAAEGLLFVLTMEDEGGFVHGKELYRHSLQAYDVHSLRPFSSPMAGLQFFTSRIFQPASSVSTRWGFLATTSASRTFQHANLEHFVRLYTPQDAGIFLNYRQIDWGYVLAGIHQYKISEAEHVITRILSLSAVLSLELYATSAYLHLFAYSRGRAAGKSFDKAISVARYALPTLPAGFTYVHAHMECSPVSLSSRDHRRREPHNILQDGEGILVVTLETQFNGGLSLQSSQEPPIDFSTLDLITAVCRISYFDKQARYAWHKRCQDMALPTAHFSYSRWAIQCLFWLPSLPNPPTVHSICGYRLLVSEKTEPDAAHAQHGAPGNQRLTIYDFSPYRIHQAIIAKDRNSKQPVPLAHDSGALGQQRLLKDDPDLQRFTTDTCGPQTPALQQRAPEFVREYRTKAPYIQATRVIETDEPYVECIAHLSHEQLLLVYQRGQREVGNEDEKGAEFWEEK